MQRLKSRAPDRRLILVCRPAFAEFFLQNKIVDEVIPLDKKNKESVRDFNNRINKLKIDNLYCLHESFRSAWLLKNIKAQKKISYKSFWNMFFFDERVERPMHLPEALRCMSLLLNDDHELKLILENKEFQYTSAHHSDDEFITFRNTSIDSPFSFHSEIYAKVAVPTQLSLGIKTPYVVLAPGSQWNTKRWTTEGFSKIAIKLLQDGFHVYLVGASTEFQVCEEVLKKVIESYNSKEETPKLKNCEILNIAGQTSLVQLQGLIANARVLVSNDSGAMHMAAMVNTPVVAIFGPTVLKFGYRPWCVNATVVQKKLGCRPCGKHGSQNCPIKTHDCMKKIDAKDVYQALKALL